MPTPSATTHATFERTAATASAIFEGEVVAVGPSPGVWSGRFVAYQTVTYRATKIVSDPDKRLEVGATVLVQHMLVAGSETADPQPRLRQALVVVGAMVIVLAKWSDGHWAGIDEHYGVVTADAPHRAALASAKVR
jgi:hypothetical protein